MRQSFPPCPAYILELEALTRRYSTNYPIPTRLRLYQALALCVPGLTRFSFTIGEQIVIRQSKRLLYFPLQIPPIKLRMIAVGYLKWMISKYTLPGFVEVEPHDTVVDCGAYIGGFGLAAAELADRVHLFEPAPDNLLCCQRNSQQFANIVVHGIGLYDVDTDIKLNMSDSSVEHSVLTPDSSPTDTALPIAVARLDTVMHDFYESNATVDFLKIEAEGVEPEVLAGAISMRPRKIAIDISPERNATSPEEQCRRQLSRCGYDIVVRGAVLFARLHALR